LVFEDVVERKAQISQQTAKVSIAAFDMGNEDVGSDIQAQAAKQRNKEKREAVLRAGREGKSVVQAKLAAKTPASPPHGEDEAVSLIKEKRRIERTIESLMGRLQEIKQQLAAARN
jgi:hypothetical protein